MVIIFLAVFGLLVGSFVNALVWRVHEQSKPKKKSKQKDLSIVNGRSMCPHCKHTLAAKDLVPVLSWLTLGGKCRYCRKSISWQYPAVELAASALFVLSYAFWPLDWDTVGVINFIGWLVILTSFIALFVYDLKWMLLPNRIVYPVTVVAGVLALLNICVSEKPGQALIMTGLSVLVAGGLFYLLFQVSNGKWIGGGDVKLGLAIGLVLQDPFKAFMMLFLASVLGSILAVPGVMFKKLSFTSKIPFGPFLIIATVLVYLFGAGVIDWYKSVFYL